MIVVGKSAITLTFDRSLSFSVKVDDMWNVFWLSRSLEYIPYSLNCERFNFMLSEPFAIPLLLLYEQFSCLVMMSYILTTLPIS